MRVCLLVVALVAGGCGSGTSSQDLSTPQDLSTATGDIALNSLCGHPGDAGNNKGVGKFCMDSSMCTGGMASVCSTLMQPPQGNTYFCTFPCNPNGSTDCGSNATCTCLDPNNPSLCGCVPDPCRIGLFG